jgi:hypothetical protein
MKMRRHSKKRQEKPTVKGLTIRALTDARARALTGVVRVSWAMVQG